MNKRLVAGIQHILVGQLPINQNDIKILHNVIRAERASGKCQNSHVNAKGNDYLHQFYRVLIHLWIIILYNLSSGILKGKLSRKLEFGLNSLGIACWP